MDRRALIKNAGLLLTLPSFVLEGCRKGASGSALLEGVDPSELIFNRRIKGRTPHMISSDVYGALEEAVRSNRALRVLAGGHGYVGQALVRDGVIADMRPHREVTVDEASGLVKVQAGARFIEVYKALSDDQGQLQYVLPTGDCPTVGVAGYTLGGGYGHLSRRFGLMCDNVVEMTVLVVDADNRIVEKKLSASSPGEDAELFWALRGFGCARFGVVTDFTFQARKKPDNLQVYDIRLRWDLRPDEITEVISIWQEWMRGYLDDPTISSKVAIGSGWYHISGLHTDVAKLASLRDRLAPFINHAETALSLEFKVDSLTHAFKQCASLQECEAQPKQAFAAKSAFIRLADVAGNARAIADAVAARRASYDTYGGIELMAWKMQGGLNEENAFVHREHELLCQFYTEGLADEDDPWMKRIFRVVTGQDRNSTSLPGYQNYTDGTIAGAETGFPPEYLSSTPRRSGQSLSESPQETLNRIRGRYRNIFG
jgi:hypothetical protein